MPTYDTILFDSDGILVEPPAYETQAKATEAAFRELGLESVERTHVDNIVEGTTVETLNEISDFYGLDVDALWEARERHDENSQFKMFRAGSRSQYPDVTTIENIQQRCGIVSNNHHSTIEFVLEFFGLKSMFDTYYGREKTVESLNLKKPNTYYLDQALTDLEAESALYIGDSESDIIAAHRANIDSVFVRRPHTTTTELQVVPTYEVIDLHGVRKIIGEYSKS